VRNGTRPPRAEYRGGRRYYPASFGARHPIVLEDNSELDIFFGLLDSKWRKILPPHVETIPHGDDFEDIVTPRFVTYDDRRKVGMTVLERRLSGKHARKNRMHWTADDVGRARNSIANEIGRLGIAPLNADGVLPVKVTQVVPVGDPDGRNYGRKLAALVDPNSREAEFLRAEHEIVVEGLRGRLNFEYPYDEDYMPKLTIGRLHSCVPVEKLEKCVEAAQSLLPVTVDLQPVKYFAHQEI
jgi:hypothetical protein